MTLGPEAIFLVALCFVSIVLALYVSWGRMSRRIPHGEGPNQELSRAIRAHANSVEHLVPIGLLAIVADLLGANRTALAWLSALALVARVLLSIGILRKGAFALRRAGAAVTYLVELALVALAAQSLVLR